MGLVKFSSEPKPIDEPPDDAIEGANWLIRILRKELHSVVTDCGLTAAERRAEVVRLSKAITSATPNHELYEARKVLREEESDLKEATLRGKVTSATTPRARHLRSNNPRRKPGR